MQYFDYSGVVKVRPEGFFFEVVTPGLHAFRMKAYATNREESQEALFLVNAVQRTSDNADLFRPPEDSGMVYLWSEVNFPVADPRRFDGKFERHVWINVYSKGAKTCSRVYGIRLFYCLKKPSWYSVPKYCAVLALVGTP